MSPFFPFSSFCLSIFEVLYFFLSATHPIPFFNRAIPSCLCSIFNLPPTKRPPIMLVMHGKFSPFGSPLRSHTSGIALLFLHSVFWLLEYSLLETVRCQTVVHIVSHVCVEDAWKTTPKSAIAFIEESHKLRRSNYRRHALRTSFGRVNHG